MLVMQPGENSAAERKFKRQSFLDLVANTLQSRQLIIHLDRISMLAYRLHAIVLLTASQLV